LVIDPESVNSTLTVVSPPPETITPTHHALDPLFNPTLMFAAEGGEVGAAVPGEEVGAAVPGEEVGAEVPGEEVGAEVLLPEAEPDAEPEEEPEEPDLYTAGPGMG